MISAGRFPVGCGTVSDYLTFIASGVEPLAENMLGADKAVLQLGDATPFGHLASYEERHRRSVSRAYLRFEAGQ